MVRARNVIKLAIVSALALARPTAAQTFLSEEAHYLRCYAHLTQLYPQSDDALLAEVRAGTKTALQACQEVFDSARFTADGGTRIADPNNPVARSIVHTFNELHRSWAREQSLYFVNGDQFGRTGSQAWYDDSPYGPFVTRALFSPSFNVDSITQGTDFLQPVRQNMSPTAILGVPNTPAPNERDWRLGTSHPLAPQGDILGVRSVNLAPISTEVRIVGLGSVPDFTTIGTSPTGTQSLSQVNMPTIAEVRGPLIPQYSSNFAIRIQGQIQIPVTGTYQFHLDIDDGAYLRLDGVQIINRNSQGIGSSSFMPVTMGTHNIEIGYRQGGGNARLHLLWTGPGIPDEYPLSDPMLPPNAQIVPAGALSGLTGEWYTTVISPQQFFTQSAGGGFLGNYNYFMTAYQHDTNFLPDGALNMDRTYGRAVFADALCREVPVIRDSDAQPYVIPGSPLAFRENAGCLTCHVSLDGGLSGLIRGLRTQTFASMTQDTPLPDLYGTLGVLIMPPTMGDPPAWSDVTDTNYWRYNPHGRFRYRNLHGSYVDVPVTSLEELGTVIRSQDDYYACLAKRYYHYFTGIEVVLGDPGNPAYPDLNGPETHHRSKVLYYADRLKSSKSLSQLIFDIIGSDEYRMPDYGISYQGGS